MKYMDAFFDGKNGLSLSGRINYLNREKMRESSHQVVCNVFKSTGFLKYSIFNSQYSFHIGGAKDE